MLPALEARSLNHWTSREAQKECFLKKKKKNPRISWVEKLYMPWRLIEGSAVAAAKSLQSCPTLCDPIDGSPPGSRPWNSPGKNTGVGGHFLLQRMKVKSESEIACPTPSDPMDCSLPGSSVHGICQARC